jgi:phosphoenolpyruvate carboxykinase (GTP)
MESINFLKEKLGEKEWEKLASLDNHLVFDFLAKFINLCSPKEVFIRTDSGEDIEYIRKKSIELKEERPLAIKGHTSHFDGYFDQARDKKNTKYLSRDILSLGSHINSIERDKGLEEINVLLKDIMKDKEMIVSFFCLGPRDSEFSLFAVQITDSYYVAHSEDILYRPAYEEFKKIKPKDFFKFVHSAGELENGVSKNIDKRRVYIDLEEDVVYSLNTQYAGNTVGLKKLALRLAIQKASKEGWLAEHMFIMGIKDTKGNPAYFCGAYPSMCGKTSTALLEGETIIGDDIAYLRVRDKKVYAVNVERGIFGIIKDVNSKDDPILFKALTKEGEVIFSNVLIDENNNPYWLGKDGPSPSKGINFSGEWFLGKKDKEGKEIPPSHKNARYTLRLSSLENVDQNLENPYGVEVKGIIYGGRDSDTSVPVEQSFNWQHGVITKGTSLESETTAATLGKEGVRSFNPFSNLDFLSIPLGRYIKMHLEFGKKTETPPLIFSVNYFLKDKEGKFLNAIEDKRIWLKWMRLRVENKVKALVTPTGLIPKYEDLRELFKAILGKEYTEEDYLKQFMLRIPENLSKIERIINIYKDLKDIPVVLFEELEAQKKRLLKCRDAFGDYVSPFNFKEE